MKIKLWPVWIVVALLAIPILVHADDKFCASPKIWTSDPIVCLEKSAYNCPSATHKALRSLLKDLTLGALLRYYNDDPATAHRHLNSYRYEVGK